MPPPTVWDFKRLGTPENMLVKAGMVQIVDGDNGMIVAAGPKLAGLFPSDKAVPPLDNIVSFLTELVIAEAYDQSGFLSGGGLRMQAAKALKEAGMGNAGLHTLKEAIAEAAEVSRAQIAEQKRGVY